MELRTKLKFCIALSVLALILKIIVTASPGWVVVKKDVMFYPSIEITPENDGFHVDDLMRPEKQRVSISFGLWYYKVCKCGKGDDDDDDSSSSEESSHENQDDMPVMEDEDRRRHHKHRHHGHHKCYHRCYRKNRHGGKDPFADPEDDTFKENDIPGEFRAASEFINNAVEYARYGRHELVWFVSVGLVLAIIGLIGAIVYAKGRGSGKHSGRLACSTQILSAFFFWMVIIKLATYIIQMKKIQEYGVIPKEIRFGCPWALFVAATGASIMGLASLFHLIMVSRDRKTGVSEYAYKTQDKVPIFAPKGYEQLIVPTMEAGPLPEKQPIS